ncbi:conserved hypothetical protein [Culex quinquefasciatus]|uniref:Doublecortin domain-containing protein n=1 Tax=Culex quinquefasciatus TaxID=7176 RepID=B0WSV3_CULQU|nr:conserved hypothetical protein [Culex quinquefasciatus]|eukprot:XP_001870720.1 conserved hypothetical protein [Culex quinquefasciatus]
MELTENYYYEEDDDDDDRRLQRHPRPLAEAASEFHQVAAPPYVPIRSYTSNVNKYYRGGNFGHHGIASASTAYYRSNGYLDEQRYEREREQVPVAREWHGVGTSGNYNGRHHDQNGTRRGESYGNNFIIMTSELGADAPERNPRTPPGNSNGGSFIGRDGGGGGTTTNTGATPAMASGENGPASQVSGLPTSPGNGTFGTGPANQQANIINNNNNSSSGQKEANESEPSAAPAPPLPAKPKPLIKSKESVSPLPLKRAASNKPTTPIRDINGNSGVGGPGNFDASPVADGDPQGPGAALSGDLAGGVPGGIRNNPNAPTRALGGIKPRKGGGWKARPQDSESFNNGFSPTDDDEAGTGGINTRNVNPVITSNVVVKGGKIGSSGGGAIGGGGRGGWGANRRAIQPVAVLPPSGSRVQSPSAEGLPIAAGVPPPMDIQSENSSSQNLPTPVHPAISGAARTLSRTDLSFDNTPGPSGLLPHNPGVPGTIGGNPQSRYSNLSFWKARRVLFYRNGDPFFPGVEIRFKPGRDICTLEALLDKISARMDLPRGARYIFSMDGDRKYSLDELEDGSSYVASSFKVFKVGTLQK